MSAVLSTSYRKQITWNGYPTDVMKSGLQKYIRRSVMEKALYCAAELDLFKEAENTKEAEGIRTNFLHRLIIIFMEDVENLLLHPVLLCGVLTRILKADVKTKFQSSSVCPATGKCTGSIFGFTSKKGAC